MISLLYVDDEPALLELAKRILESSGDFSVDTRSSAREALAALASCSYDAIVSDFQMPGMDGLAFLQHVRKEFGDIPFVMLTGQGHEEVVIHALNRGADFYLRKSKDGHVLFAQLGRVLQQCIAIRRSWKSILEREERYHDLQNANDLIQSVSPDGRFLFVNRKWLETLGYEEPDIGNLRIFDIIHQDSLEHCKDTFRRVIAGENVGIIDAVFLTRTGEPVYVEGIASCRMSDGKPQYTRGIFRDVTDRRKAEAAQKESEERFRGLAESLNDVVMRIDRNHRHLYVNPAIEGQTGMKPEDMIGKTHRELGFPEDLVNAWDTMLEHVFTTGARVQQEFCLPTGHWVDIIAVPEYTLSKEISCVIMTGRDVTERKQAEKALRESEEKFRSLVEHALDGIIILELGGTILFANNAAARTIEAEDPAQFIGRNVLDFIAPESQEEVMRDFMQVAQGHDAYLAHYQAVSARGNRIWLESIGKLITFEGRPADLVSIRDITQQRGAEQALKNQIAYNRSLIEASLDPLVTINPEGKIADVNRATEMVTGYNRAELVGTDFSDYFTSPEKAREGYRTVFREGVIHDYFLEIRHRDGQTTPVLYNASVYRDENGEISGVFAAARDVTELRRAEEAVRQTSKKLAMLSSITRHDIRNKLLTLRSYIYMAGKKVTDEEVQGYLKKQDAAAEAIGQQIEFTKDYENLGVKAPAWQNVGDIVSRAAIQLDLKGIAVKNEIRGLEIYADSMLGKVFYNLIDNSVRYGETITEIRVHAEKSGTGLVILFEDNGIGIPAEEKDRIFSKGFGKNTGLGLFLSREILSITGITINETGSGNGGVRFEIAVPAGAFRFSVSPK